MEGLLVKDKNFWSIKYPKQSKLPSKHLGSLSLNFKTEAIKSLNPFHMDGFGDLCQVQCNILWVYVHSRTFFFWEEDRQLLLDWIHA